MEEEGDTTAKKNASLPGNETGRQRWLMANKPGAAQVLLDKLRVRTTSDGFCKLSKLIPSKKNGYIQVSHNGANKFATLQEVVMWAKGEIRARPGYQISHLCDKPACTNKDHIITESSVDNNSRKNCGAVVSYIQDGEKKYLQACRHFPRCIVFIPGFKS